MTNDGSREADVLIRIYEIYSSEQMHDAFTWFYKEFHVKDFQDYEKRYPLGSDGRKYFNRLGNFLNLLGTLVQKNLMSKELIIGFCPDDVKSFWKESKSLVYEMREKWQDPTLYSDLEALNREVIKWQNKIIKQKKSTDPIRT